MPKIAEHANAPDFEHGVPIVENASRTGSAANGFNGQFQMKRADISLKLPALGCLQSE
jgi:hypothetical protein